MIEQQNNLLAAEKLSCIPSLATDINHIGTIDLELKNAEFLILIVLITREYK